MPRAPLILSFSNRGKSHSMVYSPSLSAGDSGVKPSKRVSKNMRLRSVEFADLEGMSKSHESGLCDELCKHVGLVRNEMVAVFHRGSVSSDASNASECILGSSSLNSKRLLTASERRGRSKSSWIFVIRYVVLSQPILAPFDVSRAGKTGGFLFPRYWVLVPLQFSLHLA